MAREGPALPRTDRPLPARAPPDSSNAAIGASVVSRGNGRAVAARILMDSTTCHRMAGLKCRTDHHPKARDAIPQSDWIKRARHGKFDRDLAAAAGGPSPRTRHHWSGGWAEGDRTAT